MSIFCLQIICDYGASRRLNSTSIVIAREQYNGSSIVRPYTRIIDHEAESNFGEF